VIANGPCVLVELGAEERRDEGVAFRPLVGDHEVARARQRR
jgi:hypothetical protein